MLSQKTTSELQLKYARVVLQLQKCGDRLAKYIQKSPSRGHKVNFDIPQIILKHVQLQGFSTMFHLLLNMHIS